MTSKYTRTIKGVEIDIYDILAAWGVTCPASQHAIKKLMMPGQRGGKGKAQDLAEARDAVLRAIELEDVAADDTGITSGCFQQNPMTMSHEELAEICWLASKSWWPR